MGNLRGRWAKKRDCIKRAEKGLREFLEAVERGDLAMENLPPDLKAELAALHQQLMASGRKI